MIRLKLYWKEELEHPKEQRFTGSLVGVLYILMYAYYRAATIYVHIR